MATITIKETHDFTWAYFDRSMLKVGDEITETLKDGREVVFVVMDDGVIGLKNCLGAHCMNETWTNEGGWPACDMRRYLNTEIFALLPDELQAAIKPRLIQGAYDNLWLFSEMEVFGEHDWAEKDEDPGEQLEYYKTPANRVKFDKDGSTSWWWERSPYASSSTNFCYVHSIGNASTNGASTSLGVCFGFCIFNQKSF